MDYLENCSLCKGNGYLNNLICGKCHGKKYLKWTENIINSSSNLHNYIKKKFTEFLEGISLVTLEQAYERISGYLNWLIDVKYIYSYHLIKTNKYIQPLIFFTQNGECFIWHIK